LSKKPLTGLGSIAYSLLRGGTNLRMSQKQRFYILASAIGLDRADAERRAVNRLVDCFNFSEILEDQFSELSDKIIEGLIAKGIAIPVTEEPVKQRVVEDMSVEEIRNLFKPCEHQWTTMTALDTLSFCRECSVCGGVCVINKPSWDSDPICRHPLARLVAKSDFKFVSFCPECEFWLVEPIKSRTR